VYWQNDWEESFAMPLALAAPTASIGTLSEFILDAFDALENLRVSMFLHAFFS
jgi:hypothetical protein